MIDAHFHIWELGRHGCRWPTPELDAIYRDFRLSDIEALARPLSVDGAVLIQSQSEDADTDFLLDVAENSDFVISVCGWCDLTLRNAPERIQDLAGRPKLRALRPMLQDLENDRWIIEAPIAAGVNAMIECGLVFEALVFERHLPHLAEFKNAYENFPIIIDHGAKPQIGGESFQNWRGDIVEFAKYPDVYCKLSGLMTEAPAGAPNESFKPYVDALLETFGPKRLMWGSDWPVLRLAGRYEVWLERARALCGSLDTVEMDWIFGETAKKAYGIT